MAAVLAVGRDAALSHRAAAAQLGLGRWPHLEVTAPTARIHRGIRVYTSSLPEDEVTSVRGIRVTTLPRTLLDLASVLPAHQLERVINEAEIQGQTDPLSPLDLIARHPRRKGVGAIKAILDTGPALTRGELEARFRVSCAAPACGRLVSTPMCKVTSATAYGPTVPSSSSWTVAPLTARGQHSSRIASAIAG
jgi:hypothetical protein